MQLLAHLIGQLDQLGDAELLGPLGHDVALEEAVLGALALEQLAQADAQHLAPLVEDGLDQPLEQPLVAAQLLDAVARHADHGTLDLGGRIEDGLIDGEEILHVVPRLGEDGEDAVGLGARRGRHAEGHLALDHTRAAGNQLLVVEHLEKDLRGDVVGIVAREDEGAPVEEGREVHAEEVVADDVVAQLREAVVEIGDALLVNLHGLDLAGLLDKILGEHTHAGTNLQDGNLGAGVHGVGDAAGYA